LIKKQKAVLALAFTTAVLYSCSLPLWEGFDEPFHYGYVQVLSEWRCLPVQNRTPLSLEVEKSLAFTPQSRIVLHGVAGKRERRQHLDELASSSSFLRKTPSTLVNYENQQAPLAYLLMAPLDLLCSRMTLSHRVLLLRLVGSIAAVGFSFIALRKLMNSLRVQHAFQMAALACVFESQMFWASVAHVGNDWLAIPLTIAFLAYGAIAVNNREFRDLALCATTLALGLLTKAYFLVFVPAFIALVSYQWKQHASHLKRYLFIGLIPGIIAGPWYLRNVLIYRSLSGTQESVSGISFGQALAAAPKIDWLTNSVDFMRWSLWTGNWSFLSFSRITLNIEMALLFLSGILYLAHYRRVRRAEAWVLGACGCFLLGLIYQTCATFLHTRGASTAPEPWYWQGVLSALWAVCFMGLQVSGVWGRCVATALLGVTGWIAALTYGAKLLPFYGGLTVRSTIGNVWRWWHDQPTRSLEYVVLGPVWVVYLFLSLFYLLLFAVTVSAARELWRERFPFP